MAIIGSLVDIEHRKVYKPKKFVLVISLPGAAACRCLRFRVTL
jgi:hypothetical protein